MEQHYQSGVRQRKHENESELTEKNANLSPNKKYVNTQQNSTLGEKTLT